MWGLWLPLGGRLPHRPQARYAGPWRVLDAIHQRGKIMKWTQAQESVRTVARNPYAWPGGYPVGLVMIDSEVLCSKCVKGNYRQILEVTRDYAPGNGEDPEWCADGFIVFEGTAEDHGHVECANCYHVIVGEEDR